MKNKKIAKNILVIFMFIAIIFGMKVTTFAAGSFGISSAATSLTTGGTTTATATANGCGGSFTISSSDSSVVSIEGSTYEWIENRKSFGYVKSK